MSTQIPVLKFGGRVLQGYERFGPNENSVVEQCHELATANEIYRLVEQKRNEARATRLREIAEDFILPLRAEGIVPAIVVSAFDWATDKLDQLSTYIASEPVDREYARLLMSGELRANSSLAMTLEALGCIAYSMTGRETGIRTRGGAVGALIQSVDEGYLRHLIGEGIVPVVAGFQGYYRDPKTGRNEVSILGRGGSNLTAVALAHALDQSEAIMYSNVDGIYDRAPSVYDDAQKLEEVDGRELFQWPEFPQVIQQEAVEYALSCGIDIWIRSGFDPELAGTRIVCSE